MMVSLWWVSQWDEENERPADRCAMKFISRFPCRNQAEAWAIAAEPWIRHQHGRGHLVTTSDSGEVFYIGESMHWPPLEPCTAARLRELVGVME